MSEKILIISSFPPSPCGVGSYAQEQVLALKKEGKRVYTLSFNPSSAAHFRYDSKKILALLKAFVFLPRYRFDKVYLHFTNGLIWTRHKRWNGYINKILLMLWTFCLALRYKGRCCLIGHEILTETLKQHSRYIHRFIYKRFTKIWVHTESEKKDLGRAFGSEFLKLVELVPHHQYFQAKFHGTQEEARKDLGLDLDKRIFVSIGFWLKSKGFEDGIDAFQSLQDKNSHLYIVGSLREQTPETIAYKSLLTSKASESPYVTLVEGHLSDENFDRWITAADAVLLPYHVIWSSGVAARSFILETPVIYRKHENLLDQIQDSSGKSFASQEELIELVKNTVPKTKFTSQKKQVPQTRKYLFVIGAFGKKVRGGAERFVFELATELSKRKADIEVWTTNSSEVVGRRHDLKAEDDKDLPFTIRRFPVNDRVERIFNWLHRLMQKPVFSHSALVQKFWVQTNIYGKGMKEALQDEGQRFDVIHLFHYLHGSSHQLSGIFPEKTLLHPFIHKESFLYNSVMRDLFAGVRGVTCNTQTCRQLALEAKCGLSPRLYFPIGNGVERKNFVKKNISIPLNAHYIIFIGRMISEKNIPLLLEWHARLLEEYPSAPGLLCIGQGAFSTHKVFQETSKIQHLPWAEESEKIELLSQARALVNLSKLESFSLVLMEAWLQEIPVIVHRESPALMEHIHASQGGFAVSTYEEYAKAVLNLDKENERTQVAKFGRDYVERNYTWDKVCENYFQSVENLIY